MPYLPRFGSAPRATAAVAGPEWEPVSDAAAEAKHGVEYCHSTFLYGSIIAPSAFWCCLKKSTLPAMSLR